MEFAKECGFKYYLVNLEPLWRKAIRMFSESQAATSIAKNPVHHDRTKHIEIDRHFISEKVNSGIVQLTYIPTRQQIATKALPRTSFEEFNFKGECRKDHVLIHLVRMFFRIFTCTY